MLALAGEASRVFARAACAPVLLLVLAGCAVASPFTLQSSGSGVPARTAIALPVDATPGSDQARLGAALQRAFAGHSVKLASDARYLADFAVSLSDAEAGLTTSVEATSEKAIDWQARPRNRHVFDGCDAQRMRVTLVLLDRQSGAQVYRGEGEAIACDFAEAAMDEVAEKLVADALGRFAG